MSSKILIVVLIGLLLSACNSMDEQSNITGKYRNTFEPEATHYVELKTDSTFLHYYKKGNEDAQENKGTWRFIKTDKKEEIMFSTWTTFGINKQYDCNDCLRFVKIKDDELIFNVDLPSEMNFKKEK